MKVNTGSPFIHPRTGILIAPGHLYEEFEESAKEPAPSSKKGGRKDAANRDAEKSAGGDEG
jgi:hypothetical protein